MMKTGDGVQRLRIVKASLHGEAVARIRSLITDGKLEPGSKISEKALCDLFGISRTPLREALKVLATEGLVILLPHRGARVAQFTSEELAELFPVIGALEGLAGELACARLSDSELDDIRAHHHAMLEHHARGDRAAYFAANQAIHEAIVAAAGNSVLTSMYESSRGRLRPARLLANVTRERWDEAVREHGEILAAIEQRDGAQLRQLLEDHIRQTYRAAAASGALAGHAADAPRVDPTASAKRALASG
jgi:DNA-binding GntR family transcriptional regulator